MVDYPALTPDAITRPVQSSLSPGEVAGPYSLLADGLKKTGAAAETVASSIADQQGLKAVTRDADGNVKVEQAPYFGAAAEHYANAVKFGALAQGEGEARRKDIELRQQFRDNPEGYNAAAKTFMDGLQEQYTKAAGPLVGLSLRKAVELTTTQTYKGLLTEKEHLDLYKSQYTLQSEIDYESNKLAALSGQGMTDGPEVKQSIDKIKSIQGQMLQNPRMAYTPQMAANDLGKIVSENKARAVEYNVAQVLRDPNGGYEKAVELANSIKTDTNLNLTPAQRETLSNRALAAVNTLDRDDKRIFTGISKQIQQVDKLMFDTGSPVPPEQRAAIRAQIEQIPNREDREQLTKYIDSADNSARWVQSIQHASPAQLQNYEADLESMMREKGSSPALEDSLKMVRRIIKSTNEGLTKEPLEFLNRTGRMKIDDITDFTNPAALANRAAAVHTAESSFGISLPMWKNSEKRALEHAVQAGGKEMVDASTMIVNGFGVDAPRALGDLTKSAPVFAHIGSLKISGGDEGFIEDAANGVKMRSDLEFEKTLPDNMRKPTALVHGAQSELQQEVYGSAFALLPDQAQASVETAGNAFFSQAIRNHYDLALGKEKGGEPLGLKGRGDPSVKAYDKVLQQSAGAHFIGDQQYGGVATYRSRGGFLGMGTTPDKVVVPPSVKADRFREVIGALTDEDLRTMAISPEKADGTSYPVRDLQNALPVKVPNGYRFALGDPQSADPKWMRGALGSPFVLDFDQMEPKLRQRVPDAFLGGPQHHSMLDYLNPVGTAAAAELPGDRTNPRPGRVQGEGGGGGRIDFQSSGAQRGEGGIKPKAPSTIEIPEEAARRKAEMKAAFDKLMEKEDGRKMIIDTAEQIKAGRLDFKSLK